MKDFNVNFWGDFMYEKNHRYRPITFLACLLWASFTLIFIFKYDDWMTMSKIETDMIMNHIHFYKEHFWFYEGLIKLILLAGFVRSAFYLMGWTDRREILYRLEAKDIPREYEHLVGFYNYRDTMFGTMGNADKAELYAKTAWVDGLVHQAIHSGNDRAGENTRRAVGYINTMLACNGNAENLEWLKQGAPNKYK